MTRHQVETAIAVDVHEMNAACVELFGRTCSEGRPRGAAEASMVLGGGGAGGGEAGRGGGAAGAGVRGAELLNGAGSQLSDACGVVRWRGWLPDGVLEPPAWGIPVGGVFWPVGAGMEITPPQTEQRARTPDGGTLDGSTRKIERQSGQLTFIRSLQSDARRERPAAAPAV